MEETATTTIVQLARSIIDTLDRGTWAHEGHGAAVPGGPQPWLAGRCTEALAPVGRLTLICTEHAGATLLALEPARPCTVRVPAAARHTATLALRGGALERAQSPLGARASMVGCERVVIGTQRLRTLVAQRPGTVLIVAWTARTRRRTAA